MNRVLIAMSGGVDSSAAALLLLQKGYDVTGVTLKLSEDLAGNTDNRAPEMCALLGIKHIWLDYKEIFTENVIAPFQDSYRHGLTPNPCVECNRTIKFGALFDYAVENGFDYLATGHYARINNGAIYKGRDKLKDQSYMLHSIKRENLTRVLFPLGDMTKTQARDILHKAGLPGSSQSESQDICFIPENECGGFLAKTDPTAGKDWVFVDGSGKVLGRRSGPCSFTIGQRKGLGIAVGQPAYIRAIDADQGIVTLGADQELYTRDLTAESFNWLTEPPLSEIKVKAKIRYHHREQDAYAAAEGPFVKIVFDQPQRAITPGQYAVIYSADDYGDRVLGGGVIIK